jgi:hypothetical protein
MKYRAVVADTVIADQAITDTGVADTARDLLAMKYC